MKFFNSFARIKGSRSFMYGLPFVIFMVFGSYGLRFFTNLKYEYSNVEKITPELMKQYGIKMKKTGEVTLETEYEKIAQMDIDNWENKRGPRPWEET